MEFRAGPERFWTRDIAFVFFPRRTMWMKAFYSILLKRVLLGLRSNINCPFVLWFFWTVKENFLGTPPTAIRDYFVLTYIRLCLRLDLWKTIFLSYNKRPTTLSIPNWLTTPNKKRWRPLRFGKNTPELVSTPMRLWV